MADDKDRFSTEVNDQLDSVFSDDDWDEGTGLAQNAKAVVGQPVTATPVGGGDDLDFDLPPDAEADIADQLGIKDLKVLILSLDWEITDDTMEKLESEITRLKSQWKADSVISTYMSLLELLTKYIRVKKAGAHPESFGMLRGVYDSLESMMADKDLDETARKRAVLTQVQKFNKLKKKIAGTKGKTAEKKAAPARKAQVQESRVQETQIIDAAPVAEGRPVAAAQPAVDTAALGKMIQDAVRAAMESQFAKLKEEVASGNENITQALQDLTVTVAQVRHMLENISSPASAAGDSADQDAGPAADEDFAGTIGADIDSNISDSLGSAPADDKGGDAADDDLGLPDDFDLK